VTHGDFSIGNLLAATPATTVVLDWATFGTGPIGADLAHLALSTCEDLLTDYRLGLDKTLDPAAPEMGYRVTLALIGASRAHWMLSRGLPLPDGYQEFVLSNAP
jgi:aminoglycoside phosphotransferase (APT) family kinase protein